MSERYKKPSGTSCEQAASAKPPLQVTATEMKHFEDHDILLQKEYEYLGYDTSCIA